MYAQKMIDELKAVLALDGSNRIVASPAARDAKEAGLDITWTLERSGILADGNNGFYYQTIDQAITREGDLYKVLDVLAKDVGSRCVSGLGCTRDLLCQLHRAAIELEISSTLCGSPWARCLNVHEG